MRSESSAVQRVALPHLTDELFERTNCAGVIWNESRRFRRSSCKSLGSLQAKPTFVAAGHQSLCQEVMLRDLSRGGARFIHGAQLYPGEQCTLTLANGKELFLETVWCRCIDDGVFVSGCHFVANEATTMDQ